VLVLDGIRPHPRCDRLVILELDAMTRRQRLLDRDIRWGTAVADRGHRLDATFELGRAESPKEPDLWLDATRPIDDNARRVIGSILPTVG
jgi:hypothetical protein